MRAVRYDHHGVLPRPVELPDPVPADDGVIVRVEATGVCRSDWHAWQGHDPVPLPMVPGHEFAGRVVAVGAGVRTVAVGDRVTAPFVLACGRCETCRAGAGQVCPHQEQPGFTRPGSFAEYVSVDPADVNVVPLPDSLPTVLAAALGCRFATAYRALTAHGAVGHGQWVAVHGAGGVGLSAVLIAKALGAHVVVTDVSDAALTLATAAGADAGLQVAGHSAPEVATALIDVTGAGAHVSLDALGSAVTAEASVRCLRRQGRHVQVGLLLGDASTPRLPMDLVVARELSLHGSHGMPATDYPAMLELVASGRVDLRTLVTRTVSLADAPAALAALGEPEPAPGITVVQP